MKSLINFKTESQEVALPGLSWNMEVFIIFHGEPDTSCKCFFILIKTCWQIGSCALCYLSRWSEKSFPKVNIKTERCQRPDYNPRSKPDERNSVDKSAFGSVKKLSKAFLDFTGFSQRIWIRHNLYHIRYESYNMNHKG